MKIESILISDLHLDPDNARKHDAKNLKAIKGSLKKFGQQKPIVVDANNCVIAGNGTLEAAKSLKWEKIDIVRTELKDHLARAYALADNRSSELAAWDDAVLMTTLKYLQDMKFDVGEIGFDPVKESREGLTDPDDIPEVPQNIHNVKLGDIWKLGEHRLMCADTTDCLNVKALFGDSKPDFIFSDPPYGTLQIFNKSGQVGKSSVAKAKNYGEYQGSTTFTLPPMLEAWGPLSENKYIIWGGNYFTDVLPITTGWIVWNKTVGENKHSWFSDFELAWTNLGICGRLFSHMLKGMIRAGEKVEREPPTQKPIELYTWLINEFCENSKIIGETNLGSGSTLIACEKTNRKCYGMEIDPHYVSVIIERWQNFSGKKAVKIG